MHRVGTPIAGVADDLPNSADLPDSAAYRDALPGAAAAVLGRLWGAIAREPIDGIAARHRDGDQLVIRLGSGRELRGPVAASVPFAQIDGGLTLAVDGVPYQRPDLLLAALSLPGHTDWLIVEIANSVTGMALARAAQPAHRGGAPTLTRAPREEQDPLAYFEQAVVDGHPLHPCCRTRIGMSVDDLLAYAPEHRPSVELIEVAVPPEQWLSSGAPIPPRLPMHPWQFAHLRSAHPELKPTGRTIAARPLMSLRTMAPIGEPGVHLKTAMDVQMTSAIRIVSPAAVHNGPIVSGILARLAARTTGIEILGEASAGAVLLAGEPVRSLAYIRRLIPPLAAGEIALPVAALGAPSDRDGRPLICEAVELGYGRGAGPHGIGRDEAGPDAAEDFFRDFVDVLIPATMSFLRDGVALEAHGQNTLVVLRGGRPVRLRYRDVGGVRISADRLATAGIDRPDLRGDISSDGPAELRTKLFAAMLSTVVAELVALLVREYDLAPGDLWEDVARAGTRAAADGGAEKSDVAAFFADPLPIKAMTAMRLADDPLTDIWATLPNPMSR